MMNSEVRMIPGAAVRDRRQLNSKRPTGCSSVAPSLRSPQIEPVTPTLHSPRLPFVLSAVAVARAEAVAKEDQSSLIKPNQAISCLDAIQSQPSWSLWFGVEGLILCLDPIQSHLPPAQKPPPYQPSSVKARQSSSKRFPIVTFGPQFQPPTPYIVVSVPQCTTNCGLSPQHMPIQPYNRHFPSNPVKPTPVISEG